MNIVTIGIVSISSIIPPSQFEFGTNALAEAGYRVKVAPNVAGPEVAPAEERARLLERFWLDPEIDMLLFSRGGEGADEVVPLLDWDALRARPDMPVVGFSDVTILLNAMLAKGVGHPISGPMLSYAERLTPKARDWFRRTIAGEPLPPVRVNVLRAGVGQRRHPGVLAAGKPMGGHVTRLHWLWEHGLAPSAAGRVVFLECTARHAAATLAEELEAMARGGFFDGAEAVVLCSFRHKGDELAALDSFFPAFAASLPCPVFSGFPYGHVPGILALDFRREVAVSEDGVVEFSR